MELLNAAYFVSTVTFPIPYGLDVVSHPLTACKNDIACRDKLQEMMYELRLVPTLHLHVIVKRRRGRKTTIHTNTRKKNALV